MAATPFDSAIVDTAEQALDFIGNILGPSTEYSVIGKDFDGKTPRRNAAFRWFGSANAIQGPQ